MFGQSRRFWGGLVLIVVGALLLFSISFPDFNPPFVLFALGVLMIATGTLVAALDRRTRSV